MNTYELVFLLDSSTKIIAQLKDQLNYISYNYAEPFVLLQDSTSIIIADGPTYFNVRDLRDTLKTALNNKLILDKTISYDIGYLYNEYHYVAANLPIAQLKSFKNWMGEACKVWEAYNNEMRYITWMYNDRANNIIFEITPLYPYFYCNKKEEPNYITYKKWILQYKPYLTTILPKEIAQEWLAVAEHFVKSVDDNIERWKKEAQK